MALSVIEALALPLNCSFDTARQAGAVYISYSTPLSGRTEVAVDRNFCFTFLNGAELFNINLTNQEQAACAPLAVAIVPLIGDNCGITPPE